MPPNPPSKVHGFAMRSMSLRNMQISKPEKKFLAPPLPNPGDAPGVNHMISQLLQYNVIIHSHLNCMPIKNAKLSQHYNNISYRTIIDVFTEAASVIVLHKSIICNAEII